MRRSSKLAAWQPSAWVTVAVAGTIITAAINTLLTGTAAPVSRELWVQRLSAPLASPGALAAAAKAVLGPYLRPPMRGADDLRDPIEATRALHAAGTTVAPLYSPEALGVPLWSIPLHAAPVEPAERPQYRGTFVYAPPTCLLLWPLGTLTEAQATQILDVLFRLCWLLTVCLCAGVIVAPRLLWSAAPSARASAAEVCAVVAVLLAFIPGVRMLYLVQIQALLTLLLVVAVVAWARGDEVAAGISLAVVAAVKPNWAALLIFGILRRKWRFSAALAATSTLLVLGSWWLVGSSNWLAYLTQILPRMGAVAVAYQPNQSISGMLYRWIGAGAPWLYVPVAPHAVIGLVSSAVGGLLLVLGIWPRTADSAAGRVFDLLMALLCVPLAAPVAWEHHFAWTVVAFAALLAFYRHRSDAPARGSWVLFCVAYVLTANYLYTMPVRSTGWLGLYHSHLLLAMLMLLLLTYRALRDAEAAQRTQHDDVVRPRLVRSRQ